jgi:hypothetical protein
MIWVTDVKHLGPGLVTAYERLRGLPDMAAVW